MSRRARVSGDDRKLLKW